MLSINAACLPHDTYDRLRAISDRTGVFVSRLYSFGGGGDGPTSGKTGPEWLATRPLDESLALVGMADRYEEARRRGYVVEHPAGTDDIVPFGTVGALAIDGLCALVDKHGWNDRGEAIAILREAS